MSNQVEFTIKTKADLNAAKQVEQQLEKDIAKLRVLGTETEKLAQKQAQLNKVRSSIAAAPQLGGGVLGELAGGLKDKLSGLPGVGEAIGALSGGAAAGLAAITAAAGAAAKGLHEFAGAQTRVAGLDAALAQTGQLTDEYREKLQALAAELQTTTGIADDEWIGVLQRLTQFGSTAETIERDTEAVKNLAGILGGDLASASQLIARANQGQFQSFSRMGIVIDDTGTKTEKLAKLYEELAQRGGGQLEARSKTLTGQFAQLKNATSDFFEAIGRGIASTGVLQTVLTGLTDAAAYWADVLGGVVPKVEGLTNAQKKTVQAAEESAAALAKEAAAAKALTEETTRLNSELDKQKSAKDRIADSKRDKEIAGINAFEKAGGNPVVAAKARAEVEIRYANEKQQREEATLRKQIENNKALLLKADKEIKNAIQKANDEQAKADLEQKRSDLDQQIKMQEEVVAAAVAAGNGSGALSANAKRAGLVRDRAFLGNGDGTAADVAGARAARDAVIARNLPIIEGASNGLIDKQRDLNTAQIVGGNEAATRGINTQTAIAGSAQNFAKEAVADFTKKASEVLGKSIKPEEVSKDAALFGQAISEALRASRKEDRDFILKTIRESRQIGFN